MLGYHRAGRHKMTDLYGKDAQAPSLRALQQLLLAIRLGRFLPDSSRSGRFTPHVPFGQEAAQVDEGESDVEVATLPSSSLGGSSHEAVSFQDGGLARHVPFGTIHK
eukprot:6140648-Amphidinium_carterae.1